MTHQRSNSVLKPNPSAMVGNATVKIPDPITFRKLTPATVVIMIAALRLYGTSMPFSPGWSCIRISSNDVCRSRIGGISSRKSNEPSSWVIVVVDIIEKSDITSQMKCHRHKRNLQRTWLQDKWEAD